MFVLLLWVVQCIDVAKKIIKKYKKANRKKNIQKNDFFAGLRYFLAKFNVEKKKIHLRNAIDWGERTNERMN